MPDPSKKARKFLVDNYSVAPALLEYKLFQIFKSLANQEQIAVHNDIMDDVALMVGESMKDLVEKVAQNIIFVGKSELMKEKT